MMKTVLAIFAGAALLAGADVSRPRILGVAHMAVYVSDLAKARAFYEDYLGFAEPFALKRPDGSDRIVFIKINENQYLELFAETREVQLNHISFYTDNARRMRDYLAEHGVKVPAKVGKGQTGNLNFTFKDPDGNVVEMVEYQPDSWTAREKGKFLPATRVSTEMRHIGVLIGALEPAMKFYRGLLGFEETWRGGAPILNWVNMRVPDGADYLEFMLYSKPPADRKTRGGRNHICLITPDIQRAKALLDARRGNLPAVEVRVGTNRKRLANLYDPDLTRVELMEPNTIDGTPTPSSTAPPPR